MLTLDTFSMIMEIILIILFFILCYKIIQDMQKEKNIIEGFGDEGFGDEDDEEKDEDEEDPATNTDWFDSASDSTSESASDSASDSASKLFSKSNSQVETDNSNRTIKEANKKHKDDTSEDEFKKEEFNDPNLIAAKESYDFASSLAFVLIKVPFKIAKKFVRKIADFFVGIGNQIGKLKDYSIDMWSTIFDNVKNMFKIMSKILKLGYTIMINLPEVMLKMIVSLQKNMMSFMNKF